MKNKLILSKEFLSENDEYVLWLDHIKQLYRISQIKASLKVNRELLGFYWQLGKEMAEAGENDANKIVAAMKELIETEPLARIDYVKAVDGLTMQQIDTVKKPMLVAIAVYIGTTRLIDNFIF